VLGTQRAEELLFFSQRVLPARLLSTGFRFEHPELGRALSNVLSGA
jgi:NAD dependent epimerase/dehydratase family enzyme